MTWMPLRIKTSTIHLSRLIMLSAIAMLGSSCLRMNPTFSGCIPFDTADYTGCQNYPPGGLMCTLPTGSRRKSVTCSNPENSIYYETSSGSKGLAISVVCDVKERQWVFESLERAKQFREYTVKVLCSSA
ncbi:hypothetical protein PRIPAC_91203 [Pristionchus pacificus]|uniref:Uncharacterized protein n=1 Tax=Pristionchus pacificus TaxID=54126 RepID=A0A2A6B715_PRIPA|nr:hypothetical protein PRIPAC_91203 [Pristionchus pacificus]|eukprot:PDM61679.1 hypothetical protein PRIPAC_51121 [Pristionchus pacificus]